MDIGGFTTMSVSFRHGAQFKLSICPQKKIDLHPPSVNEKVQDARKTILSTNQVETSPQSISRIESFEFLVSPSKTDLGEISPQSCIPRKTSLGFATSSEETESKV